MKICLFVVDVQNGFVNENTSFVVPRIKQLLESGNFSTVIFTKYINKTDSPYQKIMGWYGLTTPGQQDLDQLIKPYAEHVVEKEGYTAIILKVREYLLRNHIEKAYVCGIDTDCCVLTTAVDLFELGIEPVVLVNYCASNGGNESHEAAIRVIGRLIGKKQMFSGKLS